MPQKPETRAAKQVNLLLPKFVYYEKQHNPYRGGTPDFYYEGPSNILWIEYKWFKYNPASWEVLLNEKRGLSRLQQKWLRRARRNNKKTAVVAKAPNGYALFIDDAWEIGWTERDSYTALEVAQWIEFQVS